MPYTRRIPTAEVEVPDSYVTPPGSSRGTMLVFLIILLLLGWVALNRNNSLFNFGGGSISPVDWSTSSQPINAERPVISTPPVISRPSTSFEEKPVVVRTPDVRASTGFRREADVIGYAWVTANDVSVRRGPGQDYSAFVLLPQNWPVVVLRQSLANNGRSGWVFVRFETGQGIMTGWINRTYLTY